MTDPTYNWCFFLRVVTKAVVLFVLLNLLFALLYPVETLGRVSLYNVVLPGRERLPYGENPAQSYNLSLYNLPALFASHEISQPEASNEFRVVTIGDSATWGWFLKNSDTLSARLNQLDTTTADGREIVFYNLGYPDMSITKDLLLLDYAMQYDPDMIVWLFTLQSFPRNEQFIPMVANNPDRVGALIEQYDLNLSGEFEETDFLDQTIVGSRRELADLLRLQVYGFSYAATGIDQFIPDDYDLRSSDFDEDMSWKDYTEPQPLTSEELALDVIQAGVDRVGDVPLLLVNEPIFISDGENSDLRYNFWYPRWAYDAYRDLMAETAEAEGWRYIDLWDVLPPDEFTDSPVHTTPVGSQMLAETLLPDILAAYHDAQ